MPQSNPTPLSGSAFTPGDHVRWFANRMNWPLAPNNILVEGNDARYFELAAKLYRKEHTRDLLADMSIFPTGDGDEGGTYGILRHFPTFRSLIDADVDANGNRLFKAIVLLDSDSAGKSARNGLTAKYTIFQEYRDVFLLFRKMPRTSHDPVQLGNATTKENAPWKRLDCEIEDLLGADLLQRFVKQATRPLRRDPMFLESAHHYEFHEGVKPDLFRFVKERANLDDVRAVAEVLKSLRFYLGLAEDGAVVP